MGILRGLAHYYRLRFKLTKLRRHFLAPSAGLVLDVGSGDGPAPAADILCDRFLDDTERTAALRLDRPFVLGDIEALPFRTGAFAFVYCSHVLEHTRQPDRAIAELERIARAGYIEVPSEYLEKAAKSTPSHAWFVRRENGELVFSPKPDGTLDPWLNEIFDHRLMAGDDLYAAFHWARFYSLFNIGLTWNGRIPFRLAGPVSGGGDTEFAKAEETLPTPDTIRRMRRAASGEARRGRAHLSPAHWIKQRIRQRYARGKTVDLLAVVACPRCKGDLHAASSGDELWCLSCGRAYPWVDGVPCLLAGAGRELPQAEVRVECCAGD